MKLEIVSGQPKLGILDLEDKFRDILKQNNLHEEGIYIVDSEKHIMCFPETQVLHPKTLYDSIKKRVREHIESDKDLFILTYSEIVLNAVRVEIKNYEYEGGKCHQFLNDGTHTCTLIDKNGRMDYYQEDIFDVIDHSLIEILGW